MCGVSTDKKICKGFLFVPLCRSSWGGENRYNEPYLLLQFCIMYSIGRKFLPMYRIRSTLPGTVYVSRGLGKVFILVELGDLIVGDLARDYRKDCNHVLLWVTQKHF